MDLSKYETKNSDTGAQMQVLDPNGDPIKGAKITLLGKDSKAHKAIDRKRQQAAIDRMAKGKKALGMKAETLAEQSLDDLAELTLDMGPLEIDGKKIGADKTLIRQAYERYPFLAEQSREFIEDRANFF